MSQIKISCITQSLSHQPRSTQTQSTCSSSSSSIGEPSNLHLQHHSIQRNNQVMAGNNSVCVQASAPLQAVVQSTQQSTHHSSTLQALQPYTPYQTQTQTGDHHQPSQQQGSMNTIASTTSVIGGATSINHHQSAQSAPQHQIAQIQTIECSYKNCTLNNSSTSSTSKILSSSKSHRITAPDNISQYNAAVAAAAAATEASSQITGIGNNITTNINQSKYTAILPPPLFDEGATTNNLNIVPQQNSNLNDNSGVSNTNNISAGVNLKTPSSSRRYHRTIPRHLTAIDPLISAVNISGSGTLPAGSSVSNLKYASDNCNNMQVSKNNLNTSNVTGSSSNSDNKSSLSNIKKPTCQCPVQHVPMSYMGTNHISNQAQNSNIFLSTITNKLASNNSNCNSINSNSSNLKTKSPCGSKSLSQSKDSLSESSRNSTLKRSSHSSNNHHSNTHHGNNLNCSLSTPNNNKISTISKHVGELHPSTNHQIMLKSTPVLKQKHSGSSSQHQQISHHNSSVNFLRNGDTADMYNSSSFPMQLMESLSKISTENNPVLPPKMYKSSQSNCSKTQQQHVYTAVSKIHTISKSSDNSIITNAHNHHHSHHYHSGPQRSSSTSRCTANGLLASSNSSSNSYTKSLSRKDNELKSITPTLTLPSSNCNNQLNNESKSQSLGKINSSTFYPMQNNHVTYTLPKHHPNGKQSLNSTIASVVSKVPSVISIPSSSMTALESATLSLVAAAANISEREMSSKIGHLQTTTNDCKRSTLPKVIKNQQQQSQHHDKTPTHHSDFKNNENDKPLPVCTTSKNCSNPKEHFLPNDTSLDDDYLSECENCKTAHSSKYYLNDEEIEEQPQETMTLQRNKDQDKEDEQTYYRTSLTLPTNTKKTTNIKNNRETWFSSIPASSSSDEEINE